MKDNFDKNEVKNFYLHVWNCLYDCQDLNMLTQNFTKILKLYDEEYFRERKEQDHDQIEYLMTYNFKLLLIVRLLALIYGCRKHNTYSLSALVNRVFCDDSSLKQSVEDFSTKHEKLLNNMKTLRDKVIAHNESFRENSNVDKAIKQACEDIPNDEINEVILDIMQILQEVAKEYSLPEGTFNDSYYEFPFSKWAKFHYSIDL